MPYQHLLQPSFNSPDLIANHTTFRDYGVATPRKAMGAGNVQYGGLACPLRFAGGNVTQLKAWDWAVPTTATFVLSQTAGGTVASVVTDSATRSLSLPPEAQQGPLSVLFAASSAGSVQSAAIIKQRSDVTTVVTVVRVTPTSWALYVNGMPATSGPLTIPYGSSSETLTIGGAFDGCVHEAMIHAMPLSATEVYVLAGYLNKKWISAPALALTYPPPPPPLPPLLPASSIPITSWSFAEGTNVSVPAILAGDSTSACLSGYGAVDAGEAAVDASALYVLEFKVASV